MTEERRGLAPSRAGVGTGSIRRERFRSSALAKAIFRAELPAEAIRAIAPQSLYMAIKVNGLPSSGEIVEAATIEQLRLCIDFDCWSHDRFREKSFWDWLALADVTGDLSLLQKVARCADLKLVALLIARYVHVVTQSEATERPPAADYYSPDRGFTWLQVKVEDSTRHFLLTRFLALLFETNADLFYQLLAIPTTTTESILEEEAYTDRSRRLSEEGIPDRELAASLHAVLLPDDIVTALREGESHPTLDDIPPVEPIVYDGGMTDPLMHLFERVPDKELFESELSFIANGAIVQFSVDFAEQEEFRDTIAAVKGVITIGLDAATRLAAAVDPGLSPERIYELLGLQKLYRLGLFHVRALRKRAVSVPVATMRRVVDDQIFFSVLAAAREPLPKVPTWFHDLQQGKPLPTKLDGTHRALESLEEVEAISRFLEEQLESQQDAPQPALSEGRKAPSEDKG